MQLPKYVYHLAEASNWPAIRREGLRSASELIARAGLRGVKRDALERQQRREGMELSSGVRLRDQCPMPPEALARCLTGMTPEEWYTLVNAHVFFWLDPDRLNRQRKACGLRPQVVLTMDVARLVAAHAKRIALTPINTGNARRQPAKRSAATFVPYVTWMESAWASEAAALGTRERARSHTPVELTVRGAVPDLAKMILKVTELGPGELFKM
ncbi:MAG: hypothetical protein V4773_13625 [Verrucomicrobiota bacterium]